MGPRAFGDEDPVNVGTAEAASYSFDRPCPGGGIGAMRAVYCVLETYLQRFGLSMCLPVGGEGCP